MGACPECSGAMTLRDVTAGFHFAHMYAPTVIKVPVCDLCEYVDINSQEFKNEFHKAQLDFELRHPGLIEKAKEEDRRDEEIEEILHRAAEETEEADLVVNPKDARVCRRCGKTARRKLARFCSECGSPLTPDASEPRDP